MSIPEQPPKPPLLTLPFELIGKIAEFLDDDQNKRGVSDLFALHLTCRSIHNALKTSKRFRNLTNFAKQKYSIKNPPELTRQGLENAMRDVAIAHLHYEGWQAGRGWNFKLLFCQACLKLKDRNQFIPAQRKHRLRTCIPCGLIFKRNRFYFGDLTSWYNGLEYFLCSACKKLRPVRERFRIPWEIRRTSYAQRQYCKSCMPGQLILRRDEEEDQEEGGE